MRNLILAQILGGLFGRARQRRGGGPGGGLGGGLGGAAAASILAGMLRGRAGRGGLGGRGALVAMLLPFAMQWIERNGGIRAVLKRFQDKGYGRQTQSWVASGDNQDIDPHAIDEVMDAGELARMSNELGVPQEEVKQAFAEILPEMVDQLTPDGQVGSDADEVIRESIPLVAEELAQAKSETAPH